VCKPPAARTRAILQQAVVRRAAYLRAWRHAAARRHAAASRTRGRYAGTIVDRNPTGDDDLVRFDDGEIIRMPLREYDARGWVRGYTPL
jgi:hypothetical protein